jgi:putative colanic acid biosysnthesis UDP-glucose lipid carrier transferase
LDSYERNSNGMQEAMTQIETASFRAFQGAVDRPHPNRLLCGIAILTDVAGAVGSGIVAYFVRHGNFHLSLDYLLLMVVAAYGLIQLQLAFGAYSAGALQRPLRQSTKIIGAWCLVLLVLIATVYFARAATEVSRGWFGIWFISGALAVLGARVMVSRFIASLRERGLLNTRVAILGSGRLLNQLADRLGEKGLPEIELVGVFPVPRNGTTHYREWNRAAENLIELARRTRIDEVIIAVRRSRPPMKAVVDRLSTIPANINFCSDLNGLAGPPSHLALVTGTPILGLRSRPLEGWNWVGKRALDLVLGSLALAFRSVLMIAVSLLIIWDSPGPVLFRQRRYGFNNGEIVVLKFRTMRQEASSDASVAQATVGDPRITRIGRLLRRTSIDELPQLINVIFGEMSLVGPRPHAIAHNKYYAELIENYGARCRVKPGITGWAQVNGYRGETDTIEKMRRRIEHDLFYIDNWSLWLDLKILLLTVLRGFVHPNAY